MSWDSNVEYDGKMVVGHNQKCCKLECFQSLVNVWLHLHNTGGLQGVHLAKASRYARAPLPCLGNATGESFPPVFYSVILQW